MFLQGKVLVASLRALRLIAVLFSTATGFQSCSGSEQRTASDSLPVRADSAKERLHMFGDLLQGQVVEHRFTFGEDLHHPWTLVAIRKSCGCTSVDLWLTDGESRWPYNTGEVIGPGLHLELLVVLDTTEKSGPVTGVVTLVSDLPEGDVRLGFRAHVNPMLSASPSYIDFGVIHRGDAPVKQLLIAGTLALPFRLTLDTERLSEFIQCELTPVNPDSGGRSTEWLLSAQVLDDAPHGGIQEGVVLIADFDLEDPSRFVGSGLGALRREIPIQGNVVGSVALIPASGSFGLVDTGRPGVLESVLYLGGNYVRSEHSFLGSVEVLGVEGLSSSDFCVEFEESSGEGQVAMRLVLMSPPTQLVGTFRGVVSVFSTGSDSPISTMRFFGGFRPSTDNDQESSIGE